MAIWRLLAELRRRKGWGMSDKTKAAPHGRQCITTKQKQHTRPCAGGQNLTAPVITGASNLLKGKQSAKLRRVSPENSGVRIFKRCANPIISKLAGCLPNIVVLVLHNSLRVAHLCSPVAAKIPTSRVIGRCRGRKHTYRYPVIGYHSLSASLVFLRCSAFSLRPQASSTHAEKLAPAFSFFSISMQASIDSTKSYGNRIPLYADLLFLCPVAIKESRYWCFNTFEHTGGFKNAEVFKHKQLDGSDIVELECLNTLSTGKAQEVFKTAKPGSGGTLTGPLTTT